MSNGSASVAKSVTTVIKVESDAEIGAGAVAVQVFLLDKAFFLDRSLHFKILYHIVTFVSALRRFR